MLICNIMMKTKKTKKLHKKTPPNPQQKAITHTQQNREKVLLGLLLKSILKWRRPRDLIFLFHIFNIDKN